MLFAGEGIILSGGVVSLPRGPCSQAVYTLVGK